MSSFAAFYLRFFSARVARWGAMWKKADYKRPGEGADGGKGGAGGGWKPKQPKLSKPPTTEEETNDDAVVEDGTLLFGSLEPQDRHQLALASCSLDCCADQQKLEETFGFTVLKDGKRLGWLMNMQPVRAPA